MAENNKLRILFIEDMDADFELAESELSNNGISFISMRVEKSDDFIKALKDFTPDLIISDYSLPQFNGMQALKITKEFNESLPFIILTGTMNEEIAVGCMKAGATDYVIKEHIGKLSFAVKEALRYRDATLKKIEAEKSLHESEERYRSMFVNNYAVMLMVDPYGGEVVDANPAASDFYGFSHEELISKKLQEISVIQNDLLMERLNLVITGNKNHFLSKHKLRSGINRDVEVFCSPVRYMDKKLVHCIIQDITERNKAIEALHTSLDEKKELIREIYHRTKNNMQVILSMFSLQSIFSGDEKLEGVLQAMENRIRAMSLVHEKLYQSRDLSKLDLKEYLIELTNNIMTEYGITGEKIHITDKMDKTEVLIDTAIPCGLVVNELISNVAKHAFPGEIKGGLVLSLLKNSDDELELVLSDDGAGKGVNMDLNHIASLGLSIVKNIVEYQLKGKIELDSTTGMKWIIKFKDNVYQQRV